MMSVNVYLSVAYEQTSDLAQSSANLPSFTGDLLRVSETAHTANVMKNLYAYYEEVEFL